MLIVKFGKIYSDLEINTKADLCIGCSLYQLEIEADWVEPMRRNLSRYRYSWARNRPKLDYKALSCKERVRLDNLVMSSWLVCSQLIGWFASFNVLLTRVHVGIPGTDARNLWMDRCPSRKERQRWRSIDLYQENTRTRLSLN